MSMISVRRAKATDSETIAAFNVAMALETENLVIEPDTLLNGVTAMQANIDLGFYLVACNRDQVIGCLGVTYEWSDWRNGLFWWIQSVYVDPQYRGQGAFSAMFEATHEAALEAPQVVGIRLYAEKDNQRAISTYHRLGMKTTHYRLLEIPMQPAADPSYEP